MSSMNLVKRWVKRGLVGSGLAAQLLRRRVLAGDVPVVMYHGISSRALGAAQLDEHLGFYARHFESRFFSEVDAAAGERPAIVLTFDDGMRNNFEQAVPLLEKHGLKATFFIVAGIFDGLQYLWNHRLCHHLYALPDAARPQGFPALPADPQGLGLCSRRWRAARREVERCKRLPHAELQALIASVEARFADSGLAVASWFDREFRLAGAEQVRARPACVEYGSHTQRHPILTGGLSDADLAAEVAGSRQRLERETGASIDTFCFPNGDNDERVRAAVAASYRLACTTQAGMHRRGTDPWRIRRVPAAPDPLDMIASLLSAPGHPRQPAGR